MNDTVVRYAIIVLIDLLRTCDVGLGLLLLLSRYCPGVSYYYFMTYFCLLSLNTVSGVR